MTSQIKNFWNKVKLSDKLYNDEPCWNWVGAKNKQGYGRFNVNGKAVRTHRYSYELFKKSIPTGLVIDHLCKNTSCCNPDHLEPVTQKENTLKGMTGQHIRVPRTHCKRGHEYTPENIIPHTNNKRGRCRICKQRMAREYYKRGKTS